MCQCVFSTYTIVQTKYIIICNDNIHTLFLYVSETERMYVVTNALFREAAKTYHVPGDSLVIEKGTKIMIPVYSIHHDPKYYPEPYTFDPQRFSPEEKAKRPSSTYLPFGDGPRFCIGTPYFYIIANLFITEISVKLFEKRHVYILYVLYLRVCI